MVLRPCFGTRPPLSRIYSRPLRKSVLTRSVSSELTPIASLRRQRSVHCRLGPNNPNDLSRYFRDQFAGIVDKFLTPAFQCDVFFVTRSAGGLARVVVRVPSHGAVPVCAKANGPADERGNIQGIRKGEHYIRVPGPKSVVVDTPELWHGSFTVVY
jgi:hypothetical protein